MIVTGLVWLAVSPRRLGKVGPSVPTEPGSTKPDGESSAEDLGKASEIVSKPRRVEIINALMFRPTATGIHFVWPHSENIAYYRSRGFVLLVDAATIDRDAAIGEEIQRVRQEEEDMWRRRNCEEWAKAWKPRDE